MWWETGAQCRRHYYQVTCAALLRAAPTLHTWHLAPVTIMSWVPYTYSRMDSKDILALAFLFGLCLGLLGLPGQLFRKIVDGVVTRLRW